MLNSVCSVSRFEFMNKENSEEKSLKCYQWLILGCEINIDLYFLFIIVHIFWFFFFFELSMHYFSNQKVNKTTEMKRQKGLGWKIGV